MCVDVLYATNLFTFSCNQKIVQNNNNLILRCANLLLAEPKNSQYFPPEIIAIVFI